MTLHSSTKTQNKVQGGLFLNVVIAQRSAIFKLLSGKDKTLLVGGNSFLVLDLGLDVVNCIAGLNIESDGLPRESLDENLKFKV